MTRRLGLLVVSLSLVAFGCADNPLGRTVIECDADLTGTLVISAQAVPGADFLPCINALRPGWDFRHVAPESGRVWFALDSDRLGDRFVEVTLTPDCAIGNALRRPSDQEGATLHVDILEESGVAALTIVPIADRHRDHAFSMAVALSGRFVDGHRTEAKVDDSERPASVRIADALSTGGIVLIVDDVDVSSNTLSIRERDGDEEDELTPDDVIEELEDSLGDPVYRALWFYVFDNSCITYSIDAEGPGAERASTDIAAALGFFDLTELKEFARESGYRGFD